jgi:uncharacterized repeat protein (TIGR03803 family)
MGLRLARRRVTLCVCLAAVMTWPLGASSAGEPSSRAKAAGYDYQLAHEFIDKAGGIQPLAGVIQGADGHLYGTTTYGGRPGSGGGVVYRLDFGGDYEVIDVLDYAKGATPSGELVQGADGHLYGTTSIGGVSMTGTVFRVSTAGEHTVLHSFGPDQAGNTDGAFPIGLTAGPDGHFYGATMAGGSLGRGTAFRISPAGGLTVLHEFGDAPEAGPPSAAPIPGPDGQLYGTASGGANDAGVVYRLSPTGAFSIVHAFSGSNGSLSGLSVNAAGELFGATAYGGAHNLGAIYKISALGTKTVLHSFAGTDGLFPYGPVTLGSDGRIYGTATYGGPGYFEGNTLYGVLFAMRLDGSRFRLLHVFKGRPNDGSHPLGRLLEGADGRLYGTTVRGGESRQGTVFAVTPR